MLFQILRISRKPSFVENFDKSLFPKVEPWMAVSKVDNNDCQF